MGVGKFAPGQIAQRHAAKSYFAAHLSSFDADPNTSCPRCGTEQESCQQAIHRCPARTQARYLLQKEVTSMDVESPIWQEPPLIKALSYHITSTKTDFPQEINSNISFLPLHTQHSPPPPKTHQLPLEGFSFPYSKHWLFNLFLLQKTRKLVTC